MALRWVLLDMNGTLLDPGGIAVALGDRARYARLVDDAFHEALLYSMADTLSGGYRPLADHLRAALERRLVVAGAGTERLGEAMERAARLEEFPDAAGALARLRGAGLRVGVLTNSATAGAERSLQAAGLREGLDSVVGSDGAGVFKPHPAIYRHGLARVEAGAGEACMVAAHGWDLLGAGRIGMRTAWVARGEGRLSPAVPEPDGRGEDLGAVADAIVARLAGA
jgi:2-haloacid dehalogenase